MADTHSHDAQLHQHGHTHLTRYLRHGQQWAHLGTSHVHEHHHAAISHAPQPTRTPTTSMGARPHPRPRAARPVAGLADR